MDFEYEQYCFADGLFYDSPTRWGVPSDEFAVAGLALPAGWRSSRNGSWVVLEPVDASWPDQGWKIHVSATLGGAEDVLSLVYTDCLRHRIPFKFLRSRNALLAHNSKYAERSSSGKFITIYPSGVPELDCVLHRLDAQLGGRSSPYVLNDIRWGAGPLYVRYGGFVERYCRTATDGSLVPAIADPDGKLVPDQRGPAFSVPEWVQVPDFLRPHIAKRAEAPPELPYEVIRPLHFSNSGGVYLARQRQDGRLVVLKEARPHAGLDQDGQDAVTRLAREHAMLDRLAGLDVVPAVLGRLRCWEHEFLAIEHIEGTPLAAELVRRYPLIRSAPTAAAVAEYTRWALDVVRRVGAAIELLHARGVVYGDLHPRNIMLTPDGRVVLLDLELASPSDDYSRGTLGAPGFTAPAGCTGFDVDHYAMAALRLALFLPLNAMLALDPGKADALAAAILERFPVPEDFVQPIRRWLAPGLPSPRVEVGDREALGAGIARAILAGATPYRTDRLFPGDVAQFTVDGLGLAFGAAGVLYALEAAGHGRHPEHEQWLRQAVRRQRAPRCGFFDGLHGQAFALHHLGHPQLALELVERAAAGAARTVGVSLFDGSAGIGLNLLHLGRVGGAAWLTEWGLDIAERLADRFLTEPEAVPLGRPGLSYGGSGPALLLVRAYGATGQSRFLEAAVHALRRDLQRCVATSDNTLQAKDGKRVLPYLAAGSAGIGIVIAEYLRLRHHDQLAAVLPAIQRAADAEFTIHSGLFSGRAGLVCFLASLRGLSQVDQPRLEQALDRHVSRLAWHAVPYADGVAFPGDHLLRLSMDLATGSAGVLLALSALEPGRSGGLPLLSTANPRRDVGKPC